MGRRGKANGAHRNGTARWNGTRSGSDSGAMSEMDDMVCRGRTGGSR
jgi:hypothetical protein